MLGEHGGSVTAAAVRGGDHTLDGDPVRNRDTIEWNGRRYRLSVAADGRWTATYRGESVAVDLHGAEGTPILLKEEDRSFTHYGGPVTNETIVTYSNGKLRTLAARRRHLARESEISRNRSRRRASEHSGRRDHHAPESLERKVRV